MFTNEKNNETIANLRVNTRFESIPNQMFTNKKNNETFANLRVEHNN